MLGLSHSRIHYDEEFCFQVPSNDETNNFLIYHLQKYPKIHRNYALSQFIDAISSMTFIFEDETIQDLYRSYGVNACEECRQRAKVMKRKLQLKRADEKRRQKNLTKKSEYPIILKRNEFLINELRSLKESINELKDLLHKQHQAS